MDESKVVAMLRAAGRYDEARGVEGSVSDLIDEAAVLGGERTEAIKALAGEREVAIAGRLDIAKSIHLMRMRWAMANSIVHLFRRVKGQLGIEHDEVDDAIARVLVKLREAREVAGVDTTMPEPDQDVAVRRKLAELRRGS